MEVTKNDRGVLNYNRHLGSDRSGWCNVLVKSDRFSPDDLAAERPIAAERYGQKIVVELLEALSVVPFESGTLGDEMDFFEWNVMYELWKVIQQRLQILQ